MVTTTNETEARPSSGFVRRAAESIGSTIKSGWGAWSEMTNAAFDRAASAIRGQAQTRQAEPAQAQRTQPQAAGQTIREERPAPRQTSTQTQAQGMRPVNYDPASQASFRQSASLDGKTVNIEKFTQNVTENIRAASGSRPSVIHSHAQNLSADTGQAIGYSKGLRMATEALNTYERHRDRGLDHTQAQAKTVDQMRQSFASNGNDIRQTQTGVTP